MNVSRRAFLRAASGAAAMTQGMGPRAGALAVRLAGLGALAAGQAQAANTSDGYKALVCLFLQGGNDSHNWVVPTDSSSYAAYAAARGSLAIPSGQLQAIASASQGSGRSFGMPLNLASLRAWYDRGRCAVLANVGTLEGPVSLADFNAGRGLPPKLFSHNDQQSIWQSLQPEGARNGWGGRMGDILMSSNQNPVFTTVSACGNVAFLSGDSVTQYQVGLQGPVPIKAVQSGWHAGSSSVPSALQKVLASSGANDFQAEYMKVVRRSLATTNVLQTALGQVSVPSLPTTSIPLPGGGGVVLANEGLAQQFRIVAQMIAAGSRLGMRRQIFMVSIGGFDSHSNQVRDQPLLMGRVAESVNWFLGALEGQGLLNKVTLFSASDFGRGLIDNGDGCDHGWGGHYFVAGGAVKGREIYGKFPSAGLGGSLDVGAGRLLPTTGVSQVAARMGGWMGLTAAEQAQVLPNLGNFSDDGTLNFI